MAKKKKQEKRKSWCWYCDREFEDEKILVQHQRMKHFQCHICHRKLNSASGLVIHMAQVHKDTMEKVPNAVDGHDSPELEIYGMDGVPQEDLQRHYDGLPLLPYTKGKLIIGDSSILPILAAQKASVALQLAESKNMTVLGGDGAVSGASGGSGASKSSNGNVPVAPVTSGSSAMSVVSPPLPSTTNTAAPASNQPPYWPYAMPQYYQQAPSGNVPAAAAAHDMYNQSQYAASYAQYYQAYYAAQAGNNYANYQSVGSAHPITATVAPVPQPDSDEPLVIPPHVDPATNKPIPGTIFTVSSLDRSLEELRSELKKYKK